MRTAFPLFLKATGWTIFYMSIQNPGENYKITGSKVEIRWKKPEGKGPGWDGKVVEFGLIPSQQVNLEGDTRIGIFVERNDGGDQNAPISPDEGRSDEDLGDISVTITVLGVGGIKPKEIIQDAILAVI